MQNFTLRFKGKVFYLFTLALILGTLSSYGQCATVDASNQSYCYLETIDDLRFTGVANSAVFETSNTVTDTDPIDGSELLTDGETYFIGSTTESCTRVAVTVAVNSASTPVNSLFPAREDFTLSPCISANFTVANLADLFTAESGYTIVVYQDEFGTTALQANQELTPNDSYFVGQVSSTAGNCPSTRAAVGYRPTLAPSPNAQAVQTFCTGSTVGDLVANGTESNTQAIRWYRSMTSNTPLANDVVLIDGEDYFASQVVNDRNDPFPPCETLKTERTEIVVALTPAPDAGLDQTGIVCESDVQATFPSVNSIREFYLDLLGDGIPTDGTFSPSISQVLANFNADADGLGDFSTTYTIGEDSCQDSVQLTISIVESTPANAGSFDDILEVCSSAGDIVLTTLNNNDGSAFTNGRFSGTGVDNNIFDPSVGAGSYTITYTVDDQSGCITGSDSTTFNIEVSNTDSVSTINRNLCLSEVQGLISNPTEGLSFLQDILTESGISNFDAANFSTASLTEAGRLFNFLNNPNSTSGNFSFTYTDVNSCGNNDITINLVIDDSSTTSAGTDNSTTVCFSEVEPTFPSVDETRKFFLDLLDSGVSRTGTFSPTITQVIANYNADADGLGDFSTTYTVGDGTCAGTAVLTVSVVEQSPANAGSFDDLTTVCSNTEVIVLNSLTNNDANATVGGTFSGTGVTNNSFDPAVGAGTYTITYTVDDSVECASGNDTTTFTIIVQDASVSAGADNSTTVCFSEVEPTFPSVDETRKFFLNLLDSGVSRTGTFSPTIVEIIDIYNADADGLGDFSTTYTVGDGTCAGSAVLTVSVVEQSPANAGSFDDLTTVCSNTEVIVLNSLTNNDANATVGGTFSGTGVTNNSFDPAVGAGTYTITYTVDDSVECASGNDTTTFTITVQDASVSAGADNSTTVCFSEVEPTFPSVDETRKFFLNLLDSGVSRTGTFSPTIVEIIDIYNADADGLGDFSTTYTVGNGTTCEDSVTLTVSVVEQSPANAGSFDDLTTVCSNTEVIVLNSLTNNDANATVGGTFSGTGVTNNTFDPAVGAGTYTITYTIDDSVECASGNDTTTFTIIVQDASVSAGADNSTTVCFSEVEPTFPSVDETRKFFLNLLDSGVSRTGTFSPTITQVIANYNADADGLGDFSTTYTVGNGTTCEDSVTLTVSVVEQSPANAGSFDDLTTVCSNTEEIILNSLTNNDANATVGGTFSGTGVTNGIFNPAVGAGTYTITYSIDDSVECTTGNDSTTFQIEVINGAIAGGDNSIDVCRAFVDDFSPSQTRSYYLDLLDEGVSRNGTFSPTIDQIILDYNTNEDQTVFTTNYTVTNGSCSDTAVLTVNIVEEVPGTIIEIANPAPICLNGEDIQLFSLLPEGANQNGVFEGFDNGVFSPSMTGAGEFDITYSLTDASTCTTGDVSSTFTITVQDAAFAGMDMDISVCQNDGVQNLFDFLSVDADTTGEFTLMDGTIITGGLMNPSEFNPGTYTVTYTVNAINDCGNDTSELIITVQEVGNAPEVNDITFCAVQEPTGADLMMNNDDLIFYSDEGLTMMVEANTTLVDGVYYVTQLGDASCESTATTFTVTISDPGTPTIENDIQTFCQFDDPTIADLTGTLDQSTNVNWYTSTDSMEPLSPATALQDGVTYYASINDPATDCESSQRLAVNVTLECDFFIPEGISPNGDQLNDDFDIRYIEDFYPNYTIEIYNRWGDSVYKGNANTPNWDGTSNEGSLGDGLLPVGVYFYYLDYKDGSTEPKRGKVYLSR